MADGRTYSQMMGRPEPLDGPIIRTGLATVTPQSTQVNSEPLGARTGAPPRTRLFTVQVIPFSAVGGPTRAESTMITGPEPPNRVVVLTAPAIGFLIYVGDAGVSPNGGLALPPGQQYEFVLPGGQPLYAVSNAPVYVPLAVQIAAILAGDRERQY